jgi:hypothetical protein
VECLQEEGDVCVGNTTQCYADDRLLGCVSGRMTLIALCQGPEGCFDGECDQSIGAEGTLCRMSSEARACTEDGTTLLRCDQVFQVVSPCDGPLGCHSDGPNVMCDRLAAPDAP